MFKLDFSILLAISVVTVWLFSLFRVFYSRKFEDTDINLWYFNLVQNVLTLIMILFIFIFSNEIGTYSVFSVILGLVLGFANVLGSSATIKALAIGPFAYTSVIISLSAIIPTLSGIFFGETIKPLQYFGIVLMIICIVLSPDKKKDENKKSSLNWLLLSLVASLFSGAVGVAQKVHQNADAYKGEMAALLISGFAVSTVFSAFKYISSILKNKNSKTQSKTKNSKMIFILPLLAGICFAFPQAINLFLSGKLDAIIFFPIVNLLPMILSMLSAVLIFKEKLSANRWLGIGIGILSTVFLSGIIG